MDDLISEFIAGTNDSLAVTRAGLEARQRGEADADVTARIARLMHTIKGTSSFLGFTRLEALAIATEKRGGQASDAALSGILARVQLLIDAIAAEGREPAGDDGDVTAALKHAMVEEAIAIHLPTESQERFDSVLLSRAYSPAEGELKTVQVATETRSFTLPPMEETPIQEQILPPAKAEAEVEILTPPAPPLRERTRIRPPALRQARSPAVVDMLRVASELVTTRNQLLTVMRATKNAALDAPVRRLSAMIARMKKQLDPTLIERHSIARVLVMRNGTQRFAIAEQDVLELVTIGEDSPYKVQMVGDAWLLRLRERLLPLMALSDLLQRGDAKPRTQMQGTVAVMRVGGVDFGLVLEAMEETEEVVVTPLSAVVGALPLYRGMSLLGDGAVLLVLDAGGVGERFGARGGAYRPSDDRDETAVEYLLLVAGAGAKKAVQLAQVLRLESFTEAEVKAGHAEYRGAQVKLLQLPGTQRENTGRVSTVMLRHDGAVFGLVVEAIGDLAHGIAMEKRSAREPYYLGSAMLAGATADVVDVAYLARTAALEAA
jgi:chemotaxis protein histidine kinase CheA